MTSARQLAGLLYRRPDVDLWILDENDTLTAGWRAARIGRDGPWPILDVRAPGDRRPPRALRLQQIAAVKVDLAGGPRYFGDRRRMVEAELAAALRAADAERAAGRFADGLARGEEALALAGRELGEEHPLAVRALAGAADAERRLGRAARAEARAARACDLARRVLAEGDPVRVAAIAALAGVYVDTWRLERARVLAQEVVDQLRAHAGGPIARAEALAVLSLIDSRRGRQADAARLAREGLDLVAGAGPAGHRARACLLHHLGVALAMSGQLDAAGPLFEESLTERARLLGPTHPETIEATASLGTHRLLCGESSRAAALYREALALAELAHGPRHALTADYAINLAGACRQLGTGEGRLEATWPYGWSQRIRRLGAS